MKRPQVLVFTRNYLPGFKGGGPIRTIANMVHHLGSELRFHVVTRDRDFGDATPYPNVRVGHWQVVGNANVLYTGHGDRSLRGLHAILQSVPYDLLYLNSVFDPEFSIKPLLVHRGIKGSASPVVIAPRGEFLPGALAIKSSRKRAFLALASVAGLYRGVHWQASDPLELRHMERIIGSDAAISIVPNLPTRFPTNLVQSAAQKKKPGCVRLLFLGRITPIKNLVQAIRALTNVDGTVELDIYGPITDTDYWQQCQSAIRAVPAAVRVHYRGTVGRDRVAEVISSHDVLFLPSQSENYGHSIVESLSLGVPVIIGRDTPWRDLSSKGVGIDCDPNDIHALQHAVQCFVDMDATVYPQWVARAMAYGEQILDVETTVACHRELFATALNAGSPPA